MEAINGRAGSSENSARHIREASSGQRTISASTWDSTVMGPERRPVTSTGTEAAQQASGRKNTLRRMGRFYRRPRAEADFGCQAPGSGYNRDNVPGGSGFGGL